MNTVTIAESSTGLIHRAYTRGEGRRVVASAQCATDYRVGSKAVYLRNLRTVEYSDLTGKLCKKCFSLVVVEAAAAK